MELLLIRQLYTWRKKYVFRPGQVWACPPALIYKLVHRIGCAEAAPDDFDGEINELPQHVIRALDARPAGRPSKEEKRRREAASRDQRAAAKAAKAAPRPKAEPKKAKAKESASPPDEPPASAASGTAPPATDAPPAATDAAPGATQS